MKKFWSFLLGLIPKYAYVLALGFPVVLGITYFTSEWIVDIDRCISLALPIDDMIPFQPWAIIIYDLATVFWAVTYFKIVRDKPENCGIILAEFLAKAICLAFYILMPTTIKRPEPTGGGIWIAMVRFLYAADAPVNLFPSIHCMDSWLCWRGLFGNRKVGRVYKGFSLIFALAVFASTLLIKQHYFVDIFGGVAVAELGMFVAKRLHWGERYAAWCKRHNLVQQENTCIQGE